MSEVGGFECRLLPAGEAVSLAAVCRVTGDQILVTLENGTTSAFDLSTLVADPHMPGAVRDFSLPGGDRLLVRDSKLSALLDASPSLASRLESSVKLIFLSLVLLPVLGWLFIDKGIPLAAKPLALMVPDSVVERVSKELLETVVLEATSPSELSPGQLQIVESAKREISQQRRFNGNIEVLVRKHSRLGANAVALPHGAILLTDDLIALISDLPTDQRVEVLLSVIYHEIGHIDKKHGIQSLVQSLGLYIAVSMLLGDVSGVVEVAATMGIAPVLMAYSQEMELQADAYAVCELIRNGQSAERLAVALRLITSPKREAAGSSLMSTHPSLFERLEQINALATDRGTTELTRDHPGATGC